jgi:serine/threonine-protein kinase
MGVLLYNSLTGTKLFEAQTIEETLRQVLACRIPAPSTVGLKPTPALDLICVRALDRDPSRRFETAEEMMLELRRVALRENLLAPTNAIAEWVRQSVGRELAQRRLSVLDASRGSRVSAAVPAAPHPAPGPSSRPPEGPRSLPPRVSTDPPSREPNSLTRTMVITSIPSPKRWAMIAAACISAIAVLVTLVWPNYVSKLFKVKTDSALPARLETNTYADPTSSPSGPAAVGATPGSTTTDPETAKAPSNGSAPLSSDAPR